jgi:CopG family transcriptional regulator/antitoxin EndoAI
LPFNRRSIIIEKFITNFFTINKAARIRNGGIILAELKKIMISLPDNLLKEVDYIVSTEKINRSEFVREAMKLYIREIRKIEMRENMKNGYQEMAEINIKLAEMCVEIDNEQQEKYEQQLRELER